MFCCTGQSKLSTVSSPDVWIFISNIIMTLKWSADPQSSLTK